MPIRKLQGLRGLRGLSDLSAAERDSFLSAHAKELSQYSNNPMHYNIAAARMYENQKFIDSFGIDAFNQLHNGSREAYDYRNQLYKDKIVGEEFDKIFKNNKGFDYSKYSQLSSDAKLKLMESDYLTPSEFENSWQKRMKESTIARSGKGNIPNKTFAMGAGVSLMRSIASLTNAISKGRGLSEAVGLFTPGGEEAAKQMEKDKNQKILDNIYSEDADNASTRFSSEVQQAYGEYAGMSDDAVYKAFMQAITPGSYRDKNGMPNLGVPDYKKYFGDGSENERSSLMSDFSIDDMRQVLAKKKVYDANMSPEMAMTALNNDAKRYAYANEGFFRRMGLFMKDVGISSLSYTADKVNGLYNLGLLAADKLGDKPIVWVDDRGNVLDPNKTKLVKDRRGNTVYQGEDGQLHYVHRQQIDRATLHNMGRNFDGSEDTGILNPQYWTRAEQFGTLDSDEQKQYEKLGSSPYKVAYNPNEDSDLLYESFKMMSFGIADAASQLLPYGVGLFGRSLSAASKAGKVAQGLGKALDTTGKMLTFETKAGQVLQGSAGAAGIAYAYNRGAFQETLAQNLANAEEALVSTAKNDIYNRYQADKQYKAGVDKLINARAASMKADYIAQMRRDGGMRIADEKALDKMIHAKAQDAVLGELVQSNVNERKSSKEYADLQQKAIDGAGDAAMNTFLTEGLKYGFVNNLGYRKFLYTNPAGLSKKMSSSLKGLKEITTESGKKRLSTETSKFLTRGQKLKEFGKTLGSQIWGGAWTNGTDDMQVDAAERINEDSFNRYLDAYRSGKALANTYGFADSLYSYVKGLQNSMGQSTTWNSAAVGGLGSVLSVTPNMANIVRLTTKEGKEAWKNNFSKQVERDENGMPLRNEDGTLKYKDLGWKDNWRERINYLIQNGVLNTYYGKKQSERDLQNHADFVNNLLDEYKDFEDIEHLVASNMASENIVNDGDAKTIQYLKALQAINTLNNLGNDSKDPTTMSSVVQNAKTLIDRAARFTDESNDSSLNEEQISNLLSQYYASNPGLEQNEGNNLKALEAIAKNAQKLQEASKAFEDAGREISKIEKNKGITIDPSVRTQLMLQKALVNHWQERKGKMQSELGDTSADDVSMDANTYIASVGGRQNARILVKVYNRQQKEVEEELAKQKEKTAKLQEELDKATSEYKRIKGKTTYNDAIFGYSAEDSNALMAAESNIKDIQAKLNSSKMQENFIEGIIARTANKRKSLEMDMSSISLDDTTRRVALAQEELIRYQDKLRALREERKKYVNKNGERDKRYSPEKLEDIDKSIKDYMENVASRKETLERNKEKVLTADDIFSLDPITRARMMNEDNRDLYSNEQIAEIEKLEKKLIMKDADALQKIQDIALLTQRINTNEDAYNRIASNPLAASKAFDEQRAMAAQEAAGILDHHNAENFAGIIKMYDLSTRGKEDVTDEQRDEFAYKHLRQLNHRLLDIINEEKWLPEHQQQLNKAMEWRKVIEDIDAVIYNSDRSAEWKKNIDDNITTVLNNISSKEDIIPTLEKVIDQVENPETSKDIDYVLEGLKNLGYSRDATAVENRKQRKEREEADRKKKEEEQKKVEEEAKSAAEKKTEEKKVESSDLSDDASKVQSIDKDDVEGTDLDKAIAKDTPDVSDDVSKADTSGEKEVNDEASKASIEDNFGVNDETSRIIDDTGIDVNGEASQPNLEEKRSKGGVSFEDGKVSQTVDEEDLQQIPDGQMNAKKLFDDDFKGESIDMGEMYYGTAENPRKGSFIAKRTDNQIIFDMNTDSGFKPETLDVVPNEYEVVTDEQESKKNNPFITNYLKKMDGDWYFIGNFAGDKQSTEVKVSKDFDIDKAIERQQEARKLELAAKGIDVKNNNIIDNGDTIQARSETIEEQAKDITSEGKEVVVSDVNEDAATQNGIGQRNIETNVTTLSGNAMSRYEPKDLEDDGKIVLKKGKDARKDMDNYYAWMDAAGIKLQNIIDHELARIIQKSPHAKVKFMCIRTDVNATHDDHMSNHLMMVLDYDNKINKGITAIHNDDNGGVIESQGKKYLVIGVAGYGNMNKSKLALYNILFGKTKSQGIGLMVSGRVKFFKEHPNERFYVNDNLATEVVPYSQIPGYIVRQGIGDENPEYRSVKDLLANKDRNPLGYTMNDVAWGIQEITQFMLVGTTLDKVMVPRNPFRNSGSAFVLMPASNGKMVPSYLKPLMYTEMRDGALKDRIDNLLQEVVAPTYERRFKAVSDLSRIFYFSKEGNNILIGKDNGRHKNEVSIVRGDEVLKTFVLNSSFDRGEFLKAIEDLNPRINITANVLASHKALEEYNEAGALMTDAAMFSTAGSSYSVYGLDGNSNMIMPETPTNPIPKSGNSDFKNEDRKQVVFKKKYYTYSASDGNFYLEGKLVTDENDVKQLQYNMRINDNGLVPEESKGIFDYYILSTGESPLVVKVDKNTKEVKEATEKQAKEFIKRIEEKKAKEAREKEAQDAVTLPDGTKEGTLPNFVEEQLSEDIDLGDTGLTVDPETGEVIQSPNNDTNSEEQSSPDVESNNTTENVDVTSEDNSTKSMEVKAQDKSTQNFTTLVNNKIYKRRVLALVKSKWSNATKDMKGIEKFLRDKNVEVDSIGTSEADIEAWIKTIEDCR